METWKARTTGESTGTEVVREGNVWTGSGDLVTLRILPSTALTFLLPGLAVCIFQEYVFKINTFIKPN
jgi:hypothetical protein